MSYFQYFFGIFKSAKILPVPSEIDLFQEATLSIKEEHKLERLSLIIPSDLEYNIPSPFTLRNINLSNQNNITSFYSSYEYEVLYKFIYTILLEYNPYFDRYEHYWLIINKRYKIHTSIKISLFKSENNILIECFSRDKDDKFWKIYHLLKKKCNNVKENILETWENDFDNI